MERLPQEVYTPEFRAEAVKLVVETEVVAVSGQGGETAVSAQKQSVSG